MKINNEEIVSDPIYIEVQGKSRSHGWPILIALHVKL